MATQGSKACRKFGRNATKCKRYKDRGMRFENKVRKLKKHVRRFGNDKLAANRLKGLQAKGA